MQSKHTGLDMRRQISLEDFAPSLEPRYALLEDELHLAHGSKGKGGKDTGR